MFKPKKGPQDDRNIVMVREKNTLKVPNKGTTKFTEEICLHKGFSCPPPPLPALDTFGSL